MKKNFSILALMFFLFVSGVLAQEKPDFSGTWLLEVKNENSKNQSKYAPKNYTLKISHTGEEIQINRSFEINGEPRSFTLTLFSDKRGEKNLISFDTSKTEEQSETLWKKNQLFRYITFSKNSSDFVRYSSTDKKIEKYKLSEDGKILTVTTQTFYSRWNSGFEPSSQESNNSRNYSLSESKQVFRKADG